MQEQENNVRSSPTTRKGNNEMTCSSPAMRDENGEMARFSPAMRKENKSPACDSCPQNSYCVCKNESKLTLEVSKYTAIKEEEYSDSANETDQSREDHRQVIIEKTCDTTSMEVVLKDSSQLQVQEVSL